jgi:CheY-like chemotaxis protein
MDLLARRDRTVVVIDDDRDIAEVVQTILLDEGLTVSCLYLQDAGDVRAAIERIEPDCVLLDGGARGRGSAHGRGRGRGVMRPTVGADSASVSAAT